MDRKDQGPAISLAGCTAITEGRLVLMAVAQSLLSQVRNQRAKGREPSEGGSPKQRVHGPGVCGCACVKPERILTG